MEFGMEKLRFRRKMRLSLNLIRYKLRQLLQTINGRSYPSCSVIAYSERELTFTFAICYRPSVCRLSVCNARAPYAGGSNFRQYFYGIWYLDDPSIFTENFMEIVPEKPLRWGELNTRVVAKYSDSDPSKAVSRKRCKIGGKLVLITNRKSHVTSTLQFRFQGHVLFIRQNFRSNAISRHSYC